MDILSITTTVSGLFIAVAAFRIQLHSYRLQREHDSGNPGNQLDPGTARQVLDAEVDEDPVKSIASEFIFVEHEKIGVGYIRKQPICVYLDLHSASCDPFKRGTLATSLATFIKDELGDAGKRSFVASPREGNLLVGAEVAQMLQAEYLMIRTVTSPRFGYPIEGTFTPGTNAIIVDDLCMEGAFLKRCVRNLRRYGVNVSHCFCLFERLDGDSRDVLASIAVELHSKYQIDDEVLRRLREGA
ncbi:phosphoribosyltransferase [Streptomyces sp. NBC_01236]|uniref:phosphoribosyltransferase n=1 Tax=Streptomyces sp. NBC_01236 TaxID=2903789 RepID=UPI002E12155F|nr:phosphoribosyltransferase [Streptomyces sp. NBC_01236]